MKKVKVLGLVSGVLGLGLGTALFINNKSNKKRYGLDNDIDLDYSDSFDDLEDDEDFDSIFIDSDTEDNDVILDYSDSFDDLEDDDTDSIFDDADSKEEYLLSLSDVSDEDLASIGILDRAAIDFNKLPRRILKYINYYLS